jgi:hypothetical protein
MNNECIPLKSAAYSRVITVHTVAGVTGKKFVGPITGRQSGGLAGLAADPLAANDGSDYTVAGPPAAGGTVTGVAMWDQVAAGKVPVISGEGTIVPVTAGAGGVAAGDLLQVDNTGGVVTHTTGVIVGKALTAAAAGADTEVELLGIPAA